MVVSECVFLVTSAWSGWHRNCLKGTYKMGALRNENEKIFKLY